MTAVTFVAPPGWPSAQPGALPPANWQPGPTLPPAPAGWVFYRGSAGEPVLPPPGAWVPPQLAASTIPPANPTVPSTANPTGGNPAAGNPAPNYPGSAPFVSQTTQFPPLAPPAQFPGAPLPPGTLPPSGVGFPGQPVTKKKRTGLIVGLSLGGFLVVAVAGVLAFLLLTGEPQLSASQFEKITATTTVDGQSVNLEAQQTSWTWSTGSDFGTVDACTVVPVFESAHTAAYYADNDADVGFRLFDTADNLKTAEKNWQSCEQAAAAAGIDAVSSQTGITDGVTWEAFESSTDFYYGNVMATVPAPGSNSSVTSQVTEFKKLINSLR
jgi:hypothetical protein